MSEFTQEEQAIFASELRQRLPKPAEATYHSLYAFTDYASKVLGRKVGHWRSLSKEEARTVLGRCRKDYPHILNPKQENPSDQD